ncbi:MAG: hypothetical protein GY832_23595 [Chloroflexi bacterium]|nr:hypothetical protein [Chloroflexota bacterium]
MTDEKTIICDGECDPDEPINYVPTGKPRWRSTPPTVGQWYWWRAGPRSKPKAYHLHSCDPLYLDKVGMMGGQWWSEPLPLPPTEEGSND